MAVLGDFKNSIALKIVLSDCIRNKATHTRKVWRPTLRTDEKLGTQ